MSLTVEERKARGSHYRSGTVAELLARVSVQNAHDRVLAHCFGEGVLLTADEARLRALGGAPDGSQIVGVDADPAVAVAAERRFPFAAVLARRANCSAERGRSDLPFDVLPSGPLWLRGMRPS